MATIGHKVIIICFILFPVFSVSTVAANPHSSGSQEIAHLRIFNELFPDLTLEQRRAVFSQSGLRNTFRSNGTPLIVPSPNSGIDVLSAVMEKSPSIIIEALVMVPNRNRTLTMLDTYNAIGRIQNISKQLIYSSSRGGYIPLFEESTRLEEGRRNRPIPDPPPATVLPSSEIIYVHLRDTFFGNTYFRGTFSAGERGITYEMTNNSAVSFLIFPVMRAERFAMVLYVEPILGGTLIYGKAGIDVPDFLLDRINLDLQINRRVSVLINWLRESLLTIH